MQPRTPKQNKYYQRRTMQRIPQTAGEAERFLWHAIDHLREAGTLDIITYNRINSRISDLQVEQSI